MAPRMKRCSVSGWLEAAGLLLTAAQIAWAAGPEDGWFIFDPSVDAFTPDCAVDLRSLNEKFAGEHGFVTVRDGEFVRTTDGVPLRFWAVNGPPHELTGAALRGSARLLAKYGVNMV